MPFGLTMGTERANALQKSIQDELTKRGYSPDADPVMAEYITIMVINNKTGAQITAELEDLIGSEYDPIFTDWLFTEAAKGATTSEVPPQPQPQALSVQPSEQLTTHEPPPSTSRDNASNRSSHQRNGIYQQAVSQATSSGPSQKRSASARSPSPSHPNKSRRTDLPTGPRAMQREGGSSANSRSLLDRMGGHAGPNRHHRDEIQARIDNITNNSSEPNMMMAGGFPGMPMGGLDMNAMAMANPLMLQDMFMSNMALMQQLSSQIGLLQGFPPPGFTVPGGNVPGDVGVFPGGSNNHFNQGNRGRGNGRGGRGSGRGRGGSHAGASSSPKPEPNTASIPDGAIPPSQPLKTLPAAPLAAPPSSEPTTTPAAAAVPHIAAPIPTQATPQVPYAIPERPQSPTLCKFGLKCTNAHCRWSHPSPVATPESGVVLSNEACENGRNCKDKDCIKAHVSPAALNPAAIQPSIPAAAVQHVPSNATPCRFGLSCNRPNCMFTHPRPASNPQHATPCRFGTACTRTACPYQHPEGRVLPTSFHRGLSVNGPMVSVSTPEAGSMAPSPHRSMTFNNPKAKLDKQVKDLEERKVEAEKAIQEAQAAASASKNTNGTEELKQVATAA